MEGGELPAVVGALYARRWEDVGVDEQSELGWNVHEAGVRRLRVGHGRIEFNQLHRHDAVEVEIISISQEQRCTEMCSRDG